MRINSIYSRNTLPKMKDGMYVINLDEFKSTGIYLIALYVNGNDIIVCSYHVTYVFQSESTP